jgi:hypothetical protein
MLGAMVAVLRGDGTFKGWGLVGGLLANWWGGAYVKKQLWNSSPLVSNLVMCLYSLFLSCTLTFSYHLYITPLYKVARVIKINS